MSKLEELIEQLCPDGVEYRTTKDIRIDSFWLMPATPNFISEGVPYITSKNIKDGIIDFNDVKYISIDDYQAISNNRKIEVNDLLVTMIGTIGEAAFVQSEMDFYGQNLYLIRLNTEVVNRKFFYYFLTSPAVKNRLVSKKNTSSQGYIKAGNLENLTIPLPPLPVQEEIVRILDNMTKLTAELTAELKGRQKQYEYYRDSLLNFEGNTKGNVEFIALSELFNTKNGYTPSKSKEEYWTNGTIPWFRMEDIRANGRILTDSLQHVSQSAVKGNLFPKNSIIIATSATIGEHALVKVDFLANQRFTVLMLKKQYKKMFDEKFLYYYCFKLDRYCLSCLNQSSFASVDMVKFANFKFPIVPLEEQQRIVDILDLFDKLCNDISEGLPAEIEARKKQYEYYRDKLLTFKEKEA